MDVKSTGKFLALILRHHPEKVGITLDAHGWADVDALIAGVNRTGRYHLDREQLEEIVRTDNKQRYAFSADGTKIRASQGHSVQVDVEPEELAPPKILYHGTGEKSVASIDAQGLLPMTRLYVHLSKDAETAKKVGARHGKPVVYEVAAGRMHRDGYPFFLSANGVWMTEKVPAVYLTKMKAETGGPGKGRDRTQPGAAERRQHRMEIRFEKEKSRAAAYDGAQTAGVCEVVMQKSFWIITHTEVGAAWNGQGIAGRLVACVMEAAKEAGVRVKPFCSYAAHQFEKNPAYREMEDKTVITVYGMKSCPDCSWVDDQVRENPNFRIIDIGEDVRNMKTFIRLRDKSPVFDEAKKSGSIGIPCFVLEDGTVTLEPEKVGLVSRPAEGAACRIDGTGC